MIVRTYLFNNYYNRIVKGYASAADYGEPIDEVVGVELWKDGDGVSTTFTIITNNIHIDYLLLLEDDERIRSRWFIVDTHYERQGKYVLTLRRDVVFDHLRQTITAPCFIEKATPRINSPFIFNKENMTYNQVKTEERPLKDELGCAWIVGYMKKTVQEKTINVPTNPLGVDYTLENIEQYMFYNFTETPCYSNAKDYVLLTKFYYDDLFALNRYYQTGITLNGSATKPLEGGQPAIGSIYSTFQGQGREGYRTTEEPITSATNITKSLATGSWTSYESTLYDAFTEGDITVEQLKKEEGKVIYAGGEYYIVVLHYPESEVMEKDIDATSQLGIAMNNLIINTEDVYAPITPALTVQARVEPIIVELKPTSVDNFTLQITSTRRSLPNQPYDIFAMPVGNFTIIPSFTDITFTSAIIPDLPYRMAAAISFALGDELLDLQLLPYAPLNPAFLSPGELNVFDLVRTPQEGQKQDYTYFMKDNAIHGVLFWLGKESFTAEITELGIDRADTVEDLKVQSETTTCRLVSPNYNGTFEINPAMNGGLTNFKADFTLRPYSPYIRVYPEFGGLYGDNFGDARGLICGGDFSLPRTSSDWVSYQQQNKNYLVQFDRQIENMEVMNNLARIQAGIGATAGALTTGAQVAAIASTFGPGAGIAGGLGAGALSAAGGIGDFLLLNAQQAEALDFAKDQFGYTLGNIQARPYNINKLSAFDINNKIFPFLEIYEATAEEVEALRQKLRYNGYTIGCIGTLEDYITTDESYIKGKIIRQIIPDDFHLAVEIADEINKGVFIKGDII